jgi:hypothetical protein
MPSLSSSPFAREESLGSGMTESGKTFSASFQETPFAEGLTELERTFLYFNT